MKRGILKRRIGSLALAAAMAVTSVPALSREVRAAGAPEPGKFAMAEHLGDFNTDDTDGSINPAKLCFGKDSQEWWIVGSQSEGNVTLFAASPLATNKFNDNDQTQTYSEEWGCTYKKGIPKYNVDPSHYGASSLRRTILKELKTSFFSPAEQKMMKETTIYTNDEKNEDVYYTSDILYLAYGEFGGATEHLTVGTNDSSNLNNGLVVSKGYWGSGDSIWIRTNRESGPMVAGKNGVLLSWSADKKEVVPAFELDLSSVLFASAAKAGASGDAASGTIADDAAMSLRLDGSEKKIGSVEFDDKTGGIMAQKDTDAEETVFLVVQGNDGTSDWYYSVQAGEETAVTTREIQNACEISGDIDLANCKVWLETETTEDGMVYAKMAKTGEVNVTGATTLKPGGKVEHEDVAISNGEDGTVTIDKGKDGTADVTVKLSQPGNIQIAEDGSITVPAGGKIVIADGKEITLPAGGTVDIDGNAEAKEMAAGGTTATAPEGGNVTAGKDGKITVPAGGKVQTKEGEEMTLPNGGTVDIDGNAEADRIIRGETTVTAPKGGSLTADKDGKITVPAGGKVQTKEGENMTLPNGGTVDKDGNVEADRIIRGKTTVTAPEGGNATADKDGNISVPAGGKVQTGEGEEMELPNGGTVDKDGNVEAGKIVRGEITVTAPEGGNATADKDGTISVPAGGKVQTGEGEEIELPNGGTVDKDGNVVVADIPMKGSGTAEDPYQINSKTGMEKLRDLVNGGESQEGAHFKITADIDLGGDAENQWTPIGTEEHPFKGILDGGTSDGNKYTVSGLYINDANKNNQGLFGTNEGTIKNLTVQGEVTGGDNVGGIAGTNKGTIENCTNEVNVTGKNNVGGIAGKNEGTITDCSNNGTVTGSGNDVGGIAGTNTGTVSGSDNSGTVAGKDNVGGIIGSNGAAGSVENSTNSGSVTGTGTGTGGIAGKNDGTLNNNTNTAAVTGKSDVGGIAGTNDGTLRDGTNTAAVTGKDNVGGIAGTNGGAGSVEGCTNSGNVTKTEDGTGKPGAIIGNNQNTNPDAVKDDYYQKTDTVNKDIIGIGEGEGSETGTDPEGITSGQTPTKQDRPFDGSGTAEDPYKISSKEDLEKLRDLVNQGKYSEDDHFKLTTDINLGGSGENPWTPIGTEENPFKGTLDGDGHKVSGLHINDGTKDNQGLIGVNAGTIENLTVEGSVTGKDNVGGIAGTNTTDGTIKGCTSDVTVTGENNVGGIAGKNDGTITDCTNNGSVTGTGNNVGGITGDNTGTVSGSNNTGNVSGNDNVGGIVGNNGGSVENSTNSGDVTGTGTGTGGVTGKNDGSLKNDTNTGAVTGNKDVGGITGTNGENGTVEGCTNSGNVTVTGDGDSTPGAIIGNNQNTNKDAVKDDYYQKTEEINKDLTGIGEGTGAGTDPAGITSGQTPTKPEKLFDGSGTAEDPYKISSKEDLENLSDLVNGGRDFTNVHFEVTKDIDLGGSGENPWTPIGTEEKPFKGTLDGNGHTVSGLHINDETKDNQGLFGVNAGTIENLAVEGSVTGKDNVGGIAGTNTKDGTIKDCTSSVTVTGENNVGGIAGKNDGTVTGCTNHGTVTGSGTSAGGITGDNTGTVSGSDNTGTVSGNDNVGGIAGTNNGSLKDDTNTAPVTGKDDVGGIAGTNGGNGTVEGCTNSGNVTGNGNSTPGAVIGNNENTNPDAVKDDYYQKTEEINKDLTGIGEGTGAGTDPAGITSGQTPVNPEKPFNGSGTAEDPYKISSKEDLENLRDLVNGGKDITDVHFEVTKDIDLGGNGENPWTPIGTEENPFKGTLDGNGHTVSGLHINDKTKDGQGLFGVNAGTIENLAVEGSVTGKDNVGGIAGTNTKDGTIKDCTSSVTVKGENNVGGIAGKNDGTIADCTNNGTVTGTGNNVGGVTGTNTGTVSGSNNTGDVTGNDNVGGIAGTNTGTVNGSDNTGAVSGNDNVGGIAGNNTGMVSGSDNTGTVNGNDNVGGITGNNTGTVEDSTNRGTVTGSGTSAGGIAGTNNGSLKDDTNTAPVTGKDDAGGIAGTNGGNGTVEGCTNSGNVTVSGGGDSTPGAVIGNNQNTNPDAVKDDYYQKTESINKDLTGIGEGTGAGTDPAGITSGQTPEKPGRDPAEADQAAAKAFEDEKIAAVERANPVGSASWKQAVRDALEAFGKLTTGQKGLVSADAKKILADAEAILTAVEKIEAVGTVTNTSACGQKIKEARDAYDKLTSEQKAKIPETIYKALADAENTYKALTGGGSHNNGLTEEQKKQIQTIAKELGVSEETAVKINKVAQELGIPAETLLLGDKAFTSQSSENDIKGSFFSQLQLKASKVRKNSVKLTWKKIKGADGYLIYGTQCGRGTKVKLVKTIKKNSTTACTQKKLKKGKAYRYLVRAYKIIDGKRITIAASKSVHIYTTGSKYGNAKSVKVAGTKAAIQKGKKFKINASEVKEKKPLRRHRKLSYESSSTKVAEVTKNGVVKAKANGSCTIYVYAQNGLYKKIKVTVVGKAKKSTSIKLNKKAYSMKKGASFTLKPTVKPSASTDTVKWSSSNKKVAAVDVYGTVKAKKKGTAVITAKTTSGKKAACKITVK